jgi:hypothetical protein
MNDQFSLYLAQAQEHADLGLPVGASERFRFAKRVVYRVSWLFLHHQVAFNHAIIGANRELAERITRLQQRMEQELRDDLLDFADRSVSQAHEEIGDHVAEARSIQADLILEIRTLQADLSALMKSLPSHLLPDRPTADQGQHDVAETDGGSYESQR